MIIKTNFIGFFVPLNYFFITRVDGYLGSKDGVCDEICREQKTIVGDSPTMVHLWIQRLMI